MLIGLQQRRCRAQAGKFSLRCYISWTRSAAGCASLRSRARPSPRTPALHGDVRPTAQSSGRSAHVRLDARFTYFVRTLLFAVAALRWAVFRGSHRDQRRRHRSQLQRDLALGGRPPFFGSVRTQRKRGASSRKSTNTCDFIRFGESEGVTWKLLSWND